MYDAPTGYGDVAKSETREETVFLSLGVGVDSTVMDDVNFVGGDWLFPYNRHQDEAFDAIYTAANIATYEGDGIPTAASANMVLEGPDVKTGLWGIHISDENGDYPDANLVQIGLSQPHTCGVTIYTAGPNIIEGYAKYRVFPAAWTTVPLVCNGNVCSIPEIVTFDIIIIYPTKLDRAYCHPRCVEVEFGLSYTLGAAQLANEVVHIDEADPYGLSIPMSELDFEVINVNGEYDDENPDTLADRLAIGNPVHLSYTFYGPGKQFTIPMGVFYIADKRTQGNCLAVTAYDSRWNLTRAYNSWGISTSESLGDSIDAILTALDLAHVIDASVDAITPSAAYTFDESTTVLDDLQTIAQAYGIVVRMDRNGRIMVDGALSSDSYGNIPPNIQFTWPEPSQLHRYNYIDVAYSGGHVITDLREGNETRVTLSVANPLIATQAMAQAVTSRIVAHRYTKAVSVEWAGDPAIDIYDEIGAFSRWTLNGTAAEYKSIRRELTFNGMLKETVTLVK